MHIPLSHGRKSLCLLICVCVCVCVSRRTSIFRCERTVQLYSPEQNSFRCSDFRSQQSGEDLQDSLQSHEIRLVTVLCVFIFVYSLREERNVFRRTLDMIGIKFSILYIEPNNLPLSLYLSPFNSKKIQKT